MLLHHISACKRIGPSCSNLQRHNALCNASAELARECGIDAKVHDGPIFNFPGGQQRKQRPADWFERHSEVSAKDKAAFHGGHCFDLTIRSGNAAVLEDAARAKTAKYAAGLQRHPHLGLTVVAVGHDGGTGKGTKKTFERWAFNLAKLRRASAEPLGAPLQEVRSAFGFCFATSMVMQLVGYMNEVARSSASGGGGWGLAVPSNRHSRARWRSEWTTDRLVLDDSSRWIKRCRTEVQGARSNCGGPERPIVFTDNDLESGDSPMMGASMCIENGSVATFRPARHGVG